jgi:hypothetical protein
VTYLNMLREIAPHGSRVAGVKWSSISWGDGTRVKFEAACFVIKMIIWQPMAMKLMTISEALQV